MRKKTALFFYSIFTFGFSEAQILEKFENGNFSQGPVWSGDTTSFFVNADFQLQSNNRFEGSTFYLSTGNALATNTEWEFWMRLAFNPSSVNYTDVFLTASSLDLKSASLYGYFIRIGNTDDHICLYRRDADGKIYKLIAGEKSILNKSNNVMKIKVTRKGNDLWKLYRDLTGTGNHYQLEGMTSDSVYRNSTAFGISIRQSTASFFQKHFFDDIAVREFIPDTIPPKIVSVTAVSASALTVHFDKNVDAREALLFSNYSVNNGIGMPAELKPDVSNPKMIHLSFENTFNNGDVYTLSAAEISDAEGNRMEKETVDFVYYVPGRYQVVINEIFPDPDPSVGLPSYKFIELFNPGAHVVNIKNWKLTDGNNMALLPEHYLPPGGYVIVCPVNALNAYNTFGPSIGISNFPSMNISGGTIILKNEINETMHAVRYDLNSYRNELKKGGGWSLELIDPANACLGMMNWTASKDAKGGTPGKINSMHGKITDETAPALLRASMVNSSKLSLVFDKTLDSLSASAPGNYFLDKNIGVSSITVVPPFFTTVEIELNQQLKAGIVYSVFTKGTRDCTGNETGNKNQARFGIAQPVEKSDLVINEILFNPLPNGVDYVELYNRSKKIIDLKEIYLANRNSRNEISSINSVSPGPYLLFPGDYVLLTTDEKAVKGQYLAINPDAFLQMKNFPSYPNTSGNVVVLDMQGNIIDEVAYSEKWHFDLIKNFQGVSLERINADAPSVAGNFHSASSSSGYGTPGYKNSQFRPEEEFRSGITVIPEIFSPDNDGTDDYATIQYQFPEPGNVINITIFDASGRPVKYLQKNTLAGIKGFYRWDGLDEKNKKLPQGIYIIFTEVFNKEGKRRHFKNTIVLGRRR